ncbi:MAG: LLM class F420-dependent oxidoreductase [Candidatus Dadabacteria bacterium]|nr:MAG: LLM class F420-dependent oxidoreductase [Candidatus Dadabacteria bacterium]
MKFGIIPPYATAPADDPDFVRAFARLAERRGLESIWVVEHVVMPTEYRSRYPYDPSGRSPLHARVGLPDPLVWLAYAAAATKRIRLATGVLNLPQRNPVLLAKELATLDRLSQGRLEIGVGIGWLREEAQALGVSFEDRAARAEDYLKAMRALWSEPVASYEGPFVRFRDVVCEPRPLGGSVRIVIGGHTPAAARRAARFGDGFFPLGPGSRIAELRAMLEQEARRMGRDPKAIELTLVGSPDQAGAERCARLGASRMVFASPTGDLEKLDRILAEFQGGVAKRFAD